MSELSYRDTCVITRSAGDYDEWGIPLTVEEIYSGECDFQPGGQTALSIVSHNDVVYLPRQVMVMVNDTIAVTTLTGRRREGVVSNVNDLVLDLPGDCLTEIEIKNSTEK